MREDEKVVSDKMGISPKTPNFTKNKIPNLASCLLPCLVPCLFLGERARTK